MIIVCLEKVSEQELSRTIEKLLRKIEYEMSLLKEHNLNRNP